MNTEQLFRNLQERLTIKDIEFKVDQTFYHQESKSAFCALIAYKNARVDMNRLDEVIMPWNWENEYKRDSKGILQCGIGIYVEERKQTIWKWSNGMPSQFASEKGEYSDALKRAGFVWGIGRELYDLPRVKCVLNNSEYSLGDNGKPKPNYSFKPNEWYWKVDWDHEGNYGSKGLIWAKEAKGDNGYRIKPTSIYLGDGHKS